jgi:hypothetical protein
MSAVLDPQTLSASPSADAPSSGGGPDASAISKYYEGQLNQDTAALSDLAKSDKPPDFVPPAPDGAPGAPQRPQGLTAVAPLLIGLAALGGKAAGIHATTMLGATNGMVEGLIKGNEQKYKDQKQAYDTAYEQYRIKWDQQQKIFNEMRQVYKGRVDADLRALQFARQVTHDNSTVTDRDVKNHLHAVEVDDKLRKTDIDAAYKQGELLIRQRAMEAKEKQLAQMAGTPKNAALLAAFARIGVSLPQGLRSQKILQETLSGLIDKYPDKTPDEIAQMVKSGQIDMRVSTTEASKLATREAAIAPVEKSINQPGGFLEQAEKAINDVNFPPLKKEAELKRYKMEQTGDPKLSAYETRVTELRQEYAIVLAKGGLTSDASRAEAARVVPEIITPAQFKEIKKAIYQGIETAKKGVRDSITDIGGTSAPPVPTEPTVYAYDNDPGSPTYGKPKFQKLKGQWVPIAN